MSPLEHFVPDRQTDKQSDSLGSLVGAKKENTISVYVKKLKFLIKLKVKYRHMKSMLMKVKFTWTLKRNKESMS